MRDYKGYKYKKIDYDFYQLYNEKGEEEVQCINLKELKEIVDNRLKYGYWVY
jgi:hypothetical protein